MGFLDINFSGCSFKLFENDQQDRVAHEIQNGTFEAPLPSLLIASIAITTGAFLDVGANSGVYTVLGSITRPGLKVIAFEPLPACIHVFQKNIEINGIGNNVDLNMVALSDVSGTATMYIPDPGHGLLETSASLEKNFQPTKTSIQVPKRTLDEMNIQDTISVVKVDIEGHEPAFLRGAKKTIRRDRPIIFAEILRAADFQAFEDFTNGERYLPFRLRGGLAIFTPDIEFDILSWNWALVPMEKISTFQEACSSFGMEISGDYRGFVPDRSIKRRLRSALGSIRRTLAA